MLVVAAVPSAPPPSPADPAPRRGRLAALLLVLVAIGGALATQSVLGYRRAGAVAHDLDRSQAVQLLRTLGPALRGRVTDDELAQLLAERAADGLRYIAVLAPGGRLAARAGASLAPATVVPPPGGGRMLDHRLGARWRIYSPMPPRGDRGAPPPPPPPGMAPPHVIEVEPTAGAAVLREATRSLVVGLAASLALGALALLLWAALRRHDRLLARAAHDRRLASLGEMSAVLAHELRNPLASLKGHAQLLVEDLEDTGSEKARTKAQRVVTEAVRIERLTSDLLEFARTGRIERTACEPAAVLRAAAAAVASDRVELDLAGAPPRWSLDAARLGQVLTNLLVNALEAAPSGPVTATATVVDGRLVYRVRDRGPGLPAGGFARLTEPFTTTRVKGTGLGLAVAARLVALHGGTLDGRTHPDGGAEVIATLPEGT